MNDLLFNAGLIFSDSKDSLDLQKLTPEQFLVLFNLKSKHNIGFYKVSNDIKKYDAFARYSDICKETSDEIDQMKINPEKAELINQIFEEIKNKYGPEYIKNAIKAEKDSIDWNPDFYDHLAIRRQLLFYYNQRNEEQVELLKAILNDPNPNKPKILAADKSYFEVGSELSAFVREYKLYLTNENEEISKLIQNPSKWVSPKTQDG